MKLEEFLSLDLEKIFGIKIKDATTEVNNAGLQLEPDERHKRLRKIIDCYNIQDIVAHHRDSLGRLLDKPCEKCGSKEVYCGYVDSEESRTHYQAGYHHNFWHICLDCLDAKHEQSQVGYGQEREKDTECPFCSHIW